MSIFKNLENSELFAIIECNSIKEIIELLATEELAEEKGGERPPVERVTVQSLGDKRECGRNTNVLEPNDGDRQQRADGEPS